MLQKIRFFDKKRPKAIVIRIIVLDDNIQIYSYIKQNFCKFSARVWTRSTVTSWVRSNGPTDPLHISCICSIWKILHFYSSFSLNPSKSALFHELTLSLKWRLTPSYAAKDTIFWQKKTQSYRYQNYCPGWQYSNLFIWPSMWTRLEHAHCLETLNNMWFLGKRVFLSLTSVIK
jgi:hypothetical protein